MASATLPHDQPQFKPGDYFFHHMPHIRGDESEFYITSLSLLQVLHDCAVRHREARFSGRVARLMDDLRACRCAGKEQ